MTWSQWKTIFGLMLGITAGWLTHPLVWWISFFGPFRLIGLVLATANQESGFNAAAIGDTESSKGNSAGPLQFNTSTWPALTGRDLADRHNCFLSGYYAVVYIQDALLSDWDWWWQLRIPVLGFASIRWMWTHGVSDAPALFNQAWPTMKAEGRSWKGYLVSAAVFGSLSLLAAAVLAGIQWKKGKKLAVESAL